MDDCCVNQLLGRLYVNDVQARFEGIFRRLDILAVSFTDGSVLGLLNWLFVGAYAAEEIFLDCARMSNINIDDHYGNHQRRISNNTFGIIRLNVGRISGDRWQDARK